MLDFIEVHGAEHGVQNMSDVNDVITANAGGFRLYFDANYQMGYRYNRKPKINKETGEILDIEKWFIVIVIGGRVELYV